ncbi:PRC-barrel domain-containing protein [Nocardia otitidiscaviarum]|uniref:PRC-barrel domain-containing protein n=1 Tax=Nocardia otitidiscaviarum TaxID=1823 RepID=UPI001893772D|nr:PRC-barrel domain-containing protein [Nocardia otitidiscaviarum]MBF6240541.1 PRC-barrel domain-containing protein [Nocardia otitidiscaviarum]
MSERRLPTLIDLDDTALQPRSAADDIRGRTVVDRDGDEIGEVDGLVIDEHAQRVRLLRIGSGGLLGVGRTKRLVPVEAVTRIDDEAVHVDRTREAVENSAPYDPPLLDPRAYYEGLYSGYGYTPPWVPSTEPRYPPPQF